MSWAPRGTDVELVEAARRFRPDVIVADIDMPGASLLEALQQLKSVERIDAKIVFLTMHGDPGAGGRGLSRRRRRLRPEALGDRRTAHRDSRGAAGPVVSDVIHHEQRAGRARVDGRAARPSSRPGSATCCGSSGRAGRITEIAVDSRSAARHGRDRQGRHHARARPRVHRGARAICDQERLRRPLINDLVDFVNVTRVSALSL